jgi:Sensors of blue-light using FAD
MKQLVYISKATVPFTSDSLKALTDVAMTNNKKLDVTGCMLYASGYFLQLLEGADTNVQNLYNKIEKDPRHKGCKILFDTQLTNKNRLYDRWFMTSFNVDKIVDFPKELKQSIDDIISNPSSAIAVHRIFIEFKNYLAK